MTPDRTALIAFLKERLSAARLFRVPPPNHYAALATTLEQDAEEIERLKADNTEFYAAMRSNGNAANTAERDLAALRAVIQQQCDNDKAEAQDSSESPLSPGEARRAMTPNQPELIAAYRALEAENAKVRAAAKALVDKLAEGWQTDGMPNAEFYDYTEELAALAALVEDK